MFKMIEGLPEDVIGIEISGKLAHTDYVRTLIPQVEKRLEQHKTVKMLVVMPGGFEGAELAALWDDTKFGLTHWHDISHLALVTEDNAVRAATAMMAPFFPGLVRIFALADRDHAREWIVAAPHHEEG